MNDERMYVTEKRVSQLTGLSCSTLQKHRFYGKGIPYVKMGRVVRYCLDDVYRYLDAHRITHIE